MLPIIRIAFRNLFVSKKRSLLISLALFVSSFLLLGSSSMMNGVQTQMLKGYLNIQSGHVAVVWSSLKEVSAMDPGRFINNIKTFDPAEPEANTAAVERLDDFMAEHASAVRYFFPTVRKPVAIKLNGQSDHVIAYGLTEAAYAAMKDAGSLAFKSGELSFQKGAEGVVISEDKAKLLNAKIGDTLTMNTLNTAGESVSQDYRISGIYANDAGYNNNYSYVPDNSLRALFGYDGTVFDSARIYLYNLGESDAFAAELDHYLTQGDPRLRAESYEQASTFYTGTPRILKLFFMFFVVFLLAIIAVGLHSTIRMYLFERLKEFGTIRAIGFSRMQCYFLIFFELLFLALFSLVASYLAVELLVQIYGSKGVHVGSGVISYAMGGEWFYPALKVSDVALAFTIITLFALAATLTSGIKVCRQQITNLLAKTMK